MNKVEEQASAFDGAAVRPETRRPTKPAPAVINVHDAKTHFSKLLDRAHAGEEIILAKAGKPYARLVPIEAAPKPQRTPGRFKGKLGTIPDSVWFDPMSDDELDLWEGKYKTYD